MFDPRGLSHAGGFSSLNGVHILEPREVDLTRLAGILMDVEGVHTSCRAVQTIVRSSRILEHLNQL
jgi:hypothetical protein